MNEGGAAGGVGGSNSTRGLKFGSTSTTPILGMSGGVTRGPREPRRNRAPRDGTPPGPAGGVLYGGGGADDAGIGGSFSSSIGTTEGADVEGGEGGGGTSARTFTV